MTTDTEQQAPRRRDSKAALLIVSAVALLVVATLGGFRSNPSNPIETPTIHQTISEKIQQAAAAHARISGDPACRPRPSDIRHSFTNKDGAYYSVLCRSGWDTQWFYSVHFNPQGELVSVHCFIGRGVCQ